MLKRRGGFSVLTSKKRGKREEESSRSQVRCNERISLLTWVSTITGYIYTSSVIAKH